MFQGQTTNIYAKLTISEAICSSRSHPAGDFKRAEQLPVSASQPHSLRELQMTQTCVSTTQFATLMLSIGLLAAAVAAQQPYTAHRPMIVLLGDSLTEFGYGYHWKYPTDKKGWVSLLSEAYSRKADIMNRGMSGYNSRWGLQVLPQALADLGCSSQKPQQRSSLFGWMQAPHVGRCNVQLLAIWFGANDIADKEGADGRLFVPLEEYKQNLAAMVTAAKQAGVQHVMVITPPPVDEAAWAKERGLKTSDRKNSAVTTYAAAAREVAKQQGATLLDINSIFTQQGSRQLQQLLNDGVHFSPQGQSLVFQSFRGVVDAQPELAGLRSGSLPMHYPPFNQIDADNPGKTFKDLFERQIITPGQIGPVQ